MDKNKIINFDDVTEPLDREIHSAESDLSQLESEQENERQELLKLQERLESLAENTCMQLLEPDAIGVEVEANYDALSLEIDQQIIEYAGKEEFEFRKLPKLTPMDTTISILAGLLSVLIDVVFVGTPEVVKTWKEGEKLEGSILTEKLRQIGKNNDSIATKVLSWLSDKCTVPYDISAKSGVVTPNNHRLRSLSHDPLLGLFFAVVDIWLGTTIAIDDAGVLRIINNPKEQAKAQKFLPVIYYFGHIISDFHTARGIPVPGFFLTQFFAGGDSNSTIARIAEGMYKDGYDLRHLASMSVPVGVKNMLINLYLELIRKDQPQIMGIAEREKFELDHKLKKYKMKFYADAIATSGNLVKFISPPDSGNPNAINVVQWMSLVKNGAAMLAAVGRDTSAEEVMYNRQQIDRKWEELLEE